MAIKRASFAAWIALAGAILAPFSLAGCASSESRETRNEEAEKINEAQLQDQLQRFVGVFSDRVLQASEPLTTPDAPRQLHKVAMRQLLVYEATVLDIATGRYPEANLLDMLVFVELGRMILDEYWIPEVYGEKGRPLASVFAQSEEDLQRLAQRLMTRAQLAEVHELVLAWRKDNPDQRRVEQVRLFSFAATAGRMGDEREREASGLLSSVTAATRSADQAVLLAERVLFVSQRMPFLLRLQVRLGTLEVTDEALAALGQTDGTLREANELAATSAQAVGDARALVEVVRPMFEPSDSREALRIERLLTKTGHLVDDSHKLLKEMDGVERTLASADRVTDKSTVLVNDVRRLLPADEDPLAALLRRGLLYGAVLGAVVVSLFWGGYVVAHRLTRDGGHGRRGSPPAPQVSHAGPGPAQRRSSSP